jgi:hypothetical protein
MAFTIDDMVGTPKFLIWRSNQVQVNKRLTFSSLIKKFRLNTARLGHHKYIMFSPHNGKESRRLTETELKNEYKKVAISEDFAQCKHLPTVKTAWNHFYEKTLTHEHHILSGSILTVFLKVRMLFAGLNAKKKEGEQRFQMVRVNLGNNNRVIGIKLPNVYWIDKVKRAISEKSDNNNLTE